MCHCKVFKIQFFFLFYHNSNIQTMKEQVSVDLQPNSANHIKNNAQISWCCKMKKNWDRRRKSKKKREEEMRDNTCTTLYQSFLTIVFSFSCISFKVFLFSRHLTANFTLKFGVQKWNALFSLFLSFRHVMGCYNSFTESCHSHWDCSRDYW